MNAVRPKFDLKNWLRESIGESDHSPLEVDPFELRQSESKIRHELSRETDPVRRGKLLAAFRAEANADYFARFAGSEATQKLTGILNAKKTPLLYDGGSLDQRSPIRSELLAILAGTDDSNRYALFAARDLAKKVRAPYREVALAQVEQAIAELPRAMDRLAPSTGNRPVSGTVDASSRAERLAVLQQLAARLREPAAAKAIDAITSLRDRPFRYATFHNVGIARGTFAALARAVEEAVGSGRRTAASDLNGIWQATKRWMGREVNMRDSAEGFSRIHFADESRGPTFATEVARLEKLLTGRTDQLWS